MELLYTSIAKLAMYVNKINGSVLTDGLRQYLFPLTNLCDQPLIPIDVVAIEEVLCCEAGTKQDYEHEFGSKSLGEFVHEIVGLDMNAAKEAFLEYLTVQALTADRFTL